MKTTVKPELDAVAINGYQMVDASTVMNFLSHVSPKVKWKALISSGTNVKNKQKESLRDIVDALAGKRVTMYTLPGEIAKVNPKANKYTLATYFGLANCGGAVIKFYDDNYAYNIHYGTGKKDKDNRIGRSFGAGPTRSAEDASDAAYLEDLQHYIQNDTDNIGEFYRTLLASLTNTDSSNYKNITKEGQTVLTDFLAVYTAEQDRNLMDGKVNLHWDAALLEVTLLAAFHAGQEEIKLFYKNPFDGQRYFTSKTYKQQNGCDIDLEQAKIKPATLVDYWQFSSSKDREHCKRSGINITKREFRALGKAITQYLENFYPEKINNVRKYLDNVSYNKNIFYELSKFLISDKTKDSLGVDGTDLVNNFVELLEQIRLDAKELNKDLEYNYSELE